MTQPPCDREQHGDRAEALECVARRHRERWAAVQARCPNWREQLDCLMTPDTACHPPAPRPPKPLPMTFQQRFVQTLATAAEFRGAVSAWVGVAQ